MNFIGWGLKGFMILASGMRFVETDTSQRTWISLIPRVNVELLCNVNNTIYWVCTISCEIKTHKSKQLRKVPALRGMLSMMQRAGRKNSNNKDFPLWQQDNYPFN